MATWANGFLPQTQEIPVVEGKVAGQMDRIYSAIMFDLRDCVNLLTDAHFQQYAQRAMDFKAELIGKKRFDAVQTTVTALVNAYDRTPRDGVTILKLCHELRSEDVPLGNWMGVVKKHMLSFIGQLLDGSKRSVEPGYFKKEWDQACAQSKQAAKTKLETDPTLHSLIDNLRHIAQHTGLHSSGVQDLNRWLTDALDTSSVAIKSVTKADFNEKVKNLQASLYEYARDQYKESVATISNIVMDSSVHDIRSDDAVAQLNKHLATLNQMEIEAYAVEVSARRDHAIKKLNALISLAERKKDIHEAVIKMMVAELNADPKQGAPDFAQGVFGLPGKPFVLATTKANIINAMTVSGKVPWNLSTKEFPSRFRDAVIASLNSIKVSSHMQDESRLAFINNLSETYADSVLMSDDDPSTRLETVYRMVKVSDQFKDSVYPVRVIINIRKTGFPSADASVANDTARRLRGSNSNAPDEEMAMITLPENCNQPQATTPVYPIQSFEYTSRDPPMLYRAVPQARSALRVDNRPIRRRGGGSEQQIGPFFSVQFDGFRLPDYVASDMEILIADVWKRLSGGDTIGPPRHHVYSATGVSGSGKSYALLTARESSVLGNVAQYLTSFMQSDQAKGRVRCKVRIVDMYGERDSANQRTGIPDKQCAFVSEYDSVRESLPGWRAGSLRSTRLGCHQGGSQHQTDADHNVQRNVP